MSALDLINPNSVLITDEPGSGFQSTDFGDVTGAAFDATMDNFRSNSENSLINEKTEERDRAYKDKFGRDLYADAMKSTTPSDSLMNQKSGLLKKNHPDVIAAIDKYLLSSGITSSGTIDNSEGIRSRAHEQARKSLAKQQEVMAGAGASAQLFGGLVGGFGATAFDPVNVALLPFGAGAARGILKTALIEAGINMGGELLTQPIVAKWQHEVGNKYGFSDMATNVAMAGIFGGVIGGGARAIQLKLSGELPGSGMEMFGDLKEKFTKLDLPEEAAAATYMERTAHFDQAEVINYSRRSNLEVRDPNAHTRALEETNAALNEGRPIRDSEIKLTEEDIRAMDRSLAEPSFKSTVDKFAEKIDFKPPNRAPMNPVLENEKQPTPTLEKQKEIEEQYNSPEVIAKEEADFKELLEKGEEGALEAELTDGEIAAIKTAKEYADEIDADKEFIRSIGTCSI